MMVTVDIKVTLTPEQMRALAPEPVMPAVPWNDPVTVKLLSCWLARQTLPEPLQLYPERKGP